MKNRIRLTIAAILGMIMLCGSSLTALAAGTLSIAVSSAEVAAGETVTMTVYAAGADNQEVTSDMKITYDSSKLEYVSSSAGSGGGGTVMASGSEVEVKFKALASGDAYVKAEGATLTAAGAHINVSGQGSTDKNKTDDTKAETNKTEEQEEPKAALSGDNSLSSLSITSGTLSPAFKGSTTQYTAQVSGDVNEITVNPTVANSKATIESITGNTNLKAGENIVSVVVKAENGTKATYKITVTKSETAKADEKPADTKEEEPTDSDTGENACDVPVSQDAGDGTININGTAYKISNDFTDAQIPEGFIRADFEYKGTPYKGVSFELGHLGLFYLVNEENKGNFFVYDADRDGFYPFIRMGSGENEIILMVVPNGAIPPDNYEAATLTLPSGDSVPAYQYTGGEDEEIVNIEDEDTPLSGNDFYIFYGMAKDGVAGWYQYDVRQNTHQRLNDHGSGDSDKNENYDTLLETYNSLNDRYKKTKANDRKLIAVLIFVSVVLAIIIINMLLGRGNGGDDGDEEEEQRERRPKKQKKAPTEKKVRKEVQKKEVKKEVTEKVTEEAVKPKAEKTVKKAAEPKQEFVEPAFAESDEEEFGFYEADNAEIMDEFEDEPSMFGRKPKKKEKIRSKAQVRPEKKNTSRADEDDDIEFLDL